MGISDWWTVLGPPLNVLSVAEGSVVEQCSRAPGCLFDAGDGNPTQLYGDYRKPCNKDPY